MRRLWLAHILLLPLPALAQVKTSLPIDQKTSVLKWTGHAEIGTYSPSGNLSLRDGHIDLLDADFAGATLNIEMNSMTQENSDLLHHLKSADFFDVEHFPLATIKIDKIAHGTIEGTLTVKGKSAPFQSSVKVSEVSGHFTVAGKVTLDRTKYGILYNSTSFFAGLGNQAIRNTFEVEFNLNGVGVIPERYRF